MIQMVQRKCRLLISLLSAGLAVSSAPAIAGEWSFSSSYGGDKWSHGYLRDSNPCQAEDIQTTWTQGNASIDTMAYWCVPIASVNTNGAITASCVWQGGGDPTAWIKEYAESSWKIWTNVAGDISGSGSAFNSLGGTYSVQELRIDGYLRELYGRAIAERYVRVKGETQMDSSARLSASLTGGPDSVLDQTYLLADCVHYFTPGTPPANALPSQIVDAPHNSRAPYDGCTPKGNHRRGGGHRSGDPVNLATGAHLFLSESDIEVYNPYGPAVSYDRAFLSNRAAAGYASPGLTVGWTDNYDVILVAVAPGTWGALKLIYPNGAEESLTPEMSGGQPTGGFTEPIEVPYLATGTPGANTGEWNSVEIVFKDRAKWLFTPAANNTYVLSRITNRVGRYISINRALSSDRRVTTVTDDSDPVVVLMTFSYGAGDRLDFITDYYGRKVAYTHGSAANTTCLLTASQLAQTSASNPPARWTYGYQALGNQPRLTSVSIPSPTGTGNSTQTFNYQYDDVREAYTVGSIVDANGNQRIYDYAYNNGTRVEVRNSQGELQGESLENFDPASSNAAIGACDAAGNCVRISYDDVANPSKPTKIIDKDGKVTEFTYDQFGNILTSTNPRGTVTIYTYDYGVFPLGRLMSVQEGAKTATAFAYYEPSGLVQTITGLRPDGSVGLIASYTYDSLGNVLTTTTPGTPDNIVTTLNYTTDGGYSQPAKLGQALTVTDGLGHISHFRYDARGNVVWSQDALGYETNAVFNIADQLMTIAYPQVP